jgi:hypothetical protein
MNVMKYQRGLILIELVSVIVLTGFIAVATGFFLYTGLNGYLNAKNSAEGSLKAQLALDRIALELRNIAYFTNPPTTSTLSYWSNDIQQFPGSRALTYQSGTETGTIVLRIDGSDYPLLDDVSSFDINVTYSNLDHDDDDPQVDEVAAIGVGFNVNGIGKEFRTQIFPRNLVEHY